MKFYKLDILLSLLVLIYLLFVTPIANAFEMSNIFYILHFANLNSGAGIATGGNTKLIETLGEIGAGFYGGKNYKICAGFYGGINQCAAPATFFTFTITDNLIDFGILDPNAPSDRTNSLIVTNTSENGYVVNAFEDHPLALPGSNAQIPDTTCDNGLCTSTTSGPWAVHSGSSLTYGFGYRCDNQSGTNCAGGFSDPTYFKSFGATESAQTVMFGNKGQGLKSQITYRANISASQAPGLYSNTITFIATPTF